MKNDREQEVERAREEFEKLCFEIMSILSGVLLDYEKDYLTSLISHNEGGIALEDMIAAIKFHNLPLSKSDFDKIQIAGELIGLNSMKWANLKYN